MVQGFNYGSGHVNDMYFCRYEVKRPNLKLKTRVKHLLGFLPLVVIYTIGCVFDCQPFLP